MSDKHMEALHVRNLCGVALRVHERSVGELYVANRPGGFGRRRDFAAYPSWR
jgi:hypothetical protein